MTAVIEVDFLQNILLLPVFYEKGLRQQLEMYNLVFPQIRLQGGLRNNYFDSFGDVCEEF
jgi:hypothetical protein